MELKSFRIQNFKSIKDTGWINFSADNITALIGQNESGKTSILEALYAFRYGELEDDHLRNDNSLPEVICSFKITEAEFDGLLNKFTIVPDNLKKALIKNNWRVNFGQKWDSNKVYIEFIEEKYLKEIFEQIKQKKSLGSSNENLVEESSVIEELTKAEEIKPLTEDEFIAYIVEIMPHFILFEDNSSLLPNTIDLEDIQKNREVEGHEGVLNFLKVANFELDKLNTTPAKVKSYIQSINNSITVDFQDFWNQTIGKGNKIRIEVEQKNYSNDSEKPGMPFLEFWINDGEEILHPKQRSGGVRWFLSFYLQLKANAKENTNSESIFLIDEPGASLHAKAQEDVLKVFEDLRKKIQIVYTTHSAHLIDLKKLYRILAVQRSDDDKNSYTHIMDIHKLGSANNNTLAPIFTCMGIDMSHQNVIQKKNNVILEEPSAFYYLKAFMEIFQISFDVNFIPATGVNNIPQLAYMMLGWGLEFIVVMDDDGNARQVYKELKENLYQDIESKADTKIIRLKKKNGIEDVFSIDDFKKIILLDEALQIESNSNYIKKTKFSKPVTALNFLMRAKKKECNKEDFSEETIQNVTSLLNEIKSALEQDNSVSAVAPILTSDN